MASPSEIPKDEEIDIETIQAPGSSDVHNSDVIFLPESLESQKTGGSVRGSVHSVKEAYVHEAVNNDGKQDNTTKSEDERQKNVFDAIAVKLRNIFHFGRGSWNASRISPEMGSKFLNPETTNSRLSKNVAVEDAIMLETMRSGKPYELNRTASLQSSQFNESPNILEYSHRPGSRESERDINFVSYQSDIYSVNAAGKPIPITIEETKTYPNYESSSTEDSFDENGDMNSKTQLRPSVKKREPKQVLLAMWRKTYKPDCVFMYYWLMLVTLSFLYNLWIIPLRAAFIDIQETWQNVWFAFDAICDVIYITDVFIKFRTRFIREGVSIKSRRQLNRKHRKEWTLLFDFISIFPTDLFFIKSINPYYRLNRLAKLYRAYSCYRMVELKTRWPNALRVINLIHAIVVIIHYNACIYYAACLQHGYGSTLSSWAYPDPALYPDYATRTRRYTYSFYWSLQALVAIGGRPLPEADWQFVYTLYMNIFGIVLTAFIFGYSAMLLLGDNLNKLKFENSMEATRKFMKRRKLPKELRQRVEQFYDYMWNKSEFSHLDEDRMLCHLPLSIKQEIAFHGNFRALKQLPQLSKCDSSLIRSLVYKIKRRAYLPGQFVYRSGDAGTEMYIVGEGVLQIIRERDGNVSAAKAGDVFGEMNIFNLRKNHKRSTDVVSCGYTELFVLTASDVDETLMQYPRVRNMIVQQAKRERAIMRRQMSSNFYRRHSQNHRFAESKEPENDENLQSTSNVNASTKESSAARKTIREASQGTSNCNSTSFVNFSFRDDSPDSGMPSSPFRRKLSETEFKGISGVPAGGIEMIMRPDIAEKLTAVYHKNLRSLQKSLDDVWFTEVSSLKQQLADTEKERDNRAKEVIQLRKRASKDKKIKPSVRGRSVTPTIAEEKIQEISRSDVSDTEESPRKASLPGLPNLKNAKAMQSNVRDRPGTNSQKKRAFLPTSRVSLQSDTSEKPN